MEVGVDGDHVDLAERRVVVVVHLRPAEAGQPAVALVEQEAGGVEPRLASRGPRACRRSQPPCSGCQCEGAVVDGEPRLLVLARATNGRVARSTWLVDRQRPAHLVAARGPGCSPTARGQRRRGRSSARTPTSARGRRPPSATTSTAAPRSSAADRRQLVAVVRVDDELERPRCRCPGSPGRSRPGGRAPAPRRPGRRSPAGRPGRGRATGGRRAGGGRRRRGRVEQLATRRRCRSAPSAA